MLKIYRFYKTVFTPYRI